MEFITTHVAKTVAGLVTLACLFGVAPAMSFGDNRFTDTSGDSLPIESLFGSSRETANADPGVSHPIQTFVPSPRMSHAGANHSVASLAELDPELHRLLYPGQDASGVKHRMKNCHRTLAGLFRSRHAVRCGGSSSVHSCTAGCDATGYCRSECECQQGKSKAQIQLESELDFSVSEATPPSTPPPEENIRRTEYYTSSLDKPNLATTGSPEAASGSTEFEDSPDDTPNVETGSSGPPPASFDQQIDELVGPGSPGQSQPSDHSRSRPDPSGLPDPSGFLVAQSANGSASSNDPSTTDDPPTQNDHDSGSFTQMATGSSYDIRLTESKSTGPTEQSIETYETRTNRHGGDDDVRRYEEASIPDDHLNLLKRPIPRSKAHAPRREAQRTSSPGDSSVARAGGPAIRTPPPRPSESDVRVIAHRMQLAGMTTGQICQTLGIDEATFYQWQLERSRGV